MHGFMIGVLCFGIVGVDLKASDEEAVVEYQYAGYITFVANLPGLATGFPYIAGTEVAF